MRRTIAVLGVCLLIAAEPAKDAVKKDMDALQGEWTMVSGEINGEKLPDNLVEGAKRTAKGDETSVIINGQVFMKAKVTLDPSKKPKAIDYKMREGETKDKT